MKAPDECTTIEDVREAIDAIDQDILDALAHRFQYVKAITRFKKTEAEVRATDRYQAVMRARRQSGRRARLGPGCHRADVPPPHRTLHRRRDERPGLGLC